MHISILYIEVVFAILIELSPRERVQVVRAPRATPRDVREAKGVRVGARGGGGGCEDGDDGGERVPLSNSGYGAKKGRKQNINRGENDGANKSRKGGEGGQKRDTSDRAITFNSVICIRTRPSSQ
ncbi:hypothetical protein PUN28_015415 [Cardiocondyla obscurior]|uniref:Uncharacterized protein n=1 Tax=Cardiocondyla obscurior TaxID=286306 RepID=A0AAW2EW97_9HYME